MIYTEFISKIKQKLWLDERHAKTLFEMITTMIVAWDVNLKRIVMWITGTISLKSKYVKLQRFFKKCRFDVTLFAIFVAWFVNKWAYLLSMDRTNWKYGRVNINILTLGIVYKWVAFPVLRTMLDKRWNSDSEERIALIKKFREIFWEESIACVFWDREFIGKEWVKYLLENKIWFILRVRNNTLIDEMRHVYESFKYDRRYSPRFLRNKRKIWWLDVYVSWMKTEDEYLIVISDKYNEEVLKEYWKRWQIETLFWNLKTRWFDFENTHLQNLDRINCMMHVLTIWVLRWHSTWEELEKEKPIKIKKHWRKEISIFRLWLDYMKTIFYQASTLFDCSIQWLYSLLFKVV